MAGFPLVKGDWGDPRPPPRDPHNPKNWLVPPCSPQFCPQNADFLIFIQFLAILPKLSPFHKSTPFGKPCMDIQHRKFWK